MPSVRSKLYQVFRASEWWEHKLSPLFATIYATAFFLQSSIASLWSLLLLALIALVPGAIYVSVLNDLTDLKDDIASGKENRLVGKSPNFIAFLLVGCIVTGLFIGISWRATPLLYIPYLSAWVAFSLYSVPPFRLKSRGLPGVLCDASGAHLFPTILVTGLVFRWLNASIDSLWFASIATWAFFYGLRGIIWHQLSDLHNDKKVGVRTLAQRTGAALLTRVGNYLIFPLELIGFGVLLWKVGLGITIIFLFFYGLLELLRVRKFQMNLIIVTPQPRYHIIMQEYYGVFFPLTLLIASSLKYPPDAFILIAHLLLFPVRPAQTVKDIGNIFRLVREHGLFR